MQAAEFSWKEKLELHGFVEASFIKMDQQEDFYKKKMKDIMNSFFSDKEHILPNAEDKFKKTLWTYITGMVFPHLTDISIDFFGLCKRHKYYIERDEMFPFIDRLAWMGTVENVLNLLMAGWNYYWDWFVMVIQPDYLERRTNFNDLLSLLQKIVQYEKLFASSYPKLDNDDLYKVIEEAIEENKNRLNQYREIVKKLERNSHEYYDALSNPPTDCAPHYAELIKMFKALEI
jgi:hypothetical protein